MKNIFKISFVGSFLILAFIVVAQTNVFDIEFPVSELGNCGSMEECKVYCDEPDHHQSCYDWAVAKGIVRDEPQSSGLSEEYGPGGCKSREECDAYCDSSDNAGECIDFAVASGYMTAEEAERIKKEMNRTGPGGCKSHEECNAFCSVPENQVVCLQSAVDDGMITQEEAGYLLERMKMYDMGGPGPDGPRGGPDIDEEKIIEMMSDPDFVGPGNCMTMNECDNFCSQPENDEECVAFAVENGLMSPEEVEKFKRIIEEGGPGGCRGQKECDAYCSQFEHGEECLQFAVENDLIPPEEVEYIKKMMEIEKMGGPGGCMGRDECDAYCSQQEHGEECFQFAKANGLMRPDEIQMMEREMEIIRKLDSRDIGGPGGCKSREECDIYCRDSNHFEECMKFSKEQGLIDPHEIDQKMEQFRMMQETMMQMGSPSQGYGETGSSSGTGDRFMLPPGGFPSPPEGDWGNPPEDYPPMPMPSGDYPMPPEEDWGNPPEGDWSNPPENEGSLPLEEYNISEQPNELSPQPEPTPESSASFGASVLGILLWPILQLLSL